MIVRVVFLIMTAAAITGAGYAGYYGIGGASSDLDRSVRSGSGGIGVVGGGRVK